MENERNCYHHIKEAENIGIVSTIERVGTIRIERKTKDNLEKLSLEKLLRLLKGSIQWARRVR